MMKVGGRFSGFYRGMIYILPVALFFSYWPLMYLGTNNTMNFELSIPLLWLVVFVFFSFVMVIRRNTWKWILDKWRWLVFPMFVALSLIWSRDFIRGGLIVGVLLALYFAVLIIIAFRDEVRDERFCKNFCRVVFAVALVISGWCFLQSIMDVMGAPREQTLLCAGCVYRVFGFPHPNGFAAEPQFMGNLLILPLLLSLYLWMRGAVFPKKWMATFFFVFGVTLFLTLSRGAIYASVVALVIFMVGWRIKMGDWRPLVAWLVVAFALITALNMQGIFAEMSPTNDTYISGVSKAVNQLTLGVVDFGGSQIKKETTRGEKDEETGGDQLWDTGGDWNGEEKKGSDEALFDGYVEISTTNRIDGWKSALVTWCKDWFTVFFGTGIGGGLTTMYEYGVTETSREIVNNQYVNLLLETGVVGVTLASYCVWLIFKAIRRRADSVLLVSLLVAYGVSLLFFSGLPNALHIYLLPAALAAIYLPPRLRLAHQ